MTELYVARRLLSRAPELRDIGGAKHITGYASVFNKASRNLGGFVEQIDRRAFDQSMLNGWPDVVCRYNHDDNYLLGTTQADTLRLIVDETGLLYDCLPPSFRADIVELCQRGDVTKSSFAFRVPEAGDYWERSGPGGFPMRTVVNTELVDVAPVNVPAYPDATASARSLDGDLLASLARYAHADEAEVRSYLAQNEESVVKFFKRSDRPSAQTEESEMTTKTNEDEDRKKLTSKERDALPNSAFAYVDGDGVGHFPIHDASHVRNALARIAQGAQYGQEALPKVKAAAKKFGIDSEEQKNIIDLVAEMRGSLPPWLQKAQDKKDAAAGKGDGKADDADDKDDDEDDEDDSKSDADSKSKKPAKKPAKAEKKSDDEESEERDAEDEELTEEERAAKASYADLETCGECGATGQYGKHCTGCGQPMGDAPMPGKHCSNCGSKMTGNRSEHECGTEERSDVETEATADETEAEEAKRAAIAERDALYADMLANRYDPYFFDSDED